MSHVNPPDDQLRALLTDARTIAVVGASSNPERPSHGIMKKLMAVGYRVVPVHPTETTVLEQRVYATLADIPFDIDIVDVFLRPEATPAIAMAAVEKGAKALWLQLGITNDDAAARAHSAGLIVVMNACIAVAHARLRIPPKTTSDAT